MEAICPACGSAERIGWEVIGVYDGTLYWECVACGHAYPRAHDRECLNAAAAEVAQRHNAERRE